MQDGSGSRLFLQPPSQPYPGPLEPSQQLEDAPAQAGCELDFGSMRPAGLDLIGVSSAVYFKQSIGCWLGVPSPRQYPEAPCVCVRMCACGGGVIPDALLPRDFLCPGLCLGGP